jgi:CMP-N,N'-diacetyllegionaminic acid synthase
VTVRPGTEDAREHVGRHERGDPATADIGPVTHAAPHVRAVRRPDRDASSGAGPAVLRDPATSLPWAGTVVCRQDGTDRMVEVLALVGLRSGSQGLPDKNVLPLAGHPLAAWIIAAARRSSRVNRIVVSTDSADYAALARRYGAETPVLRPAELAGHDAPDSLFVAHMLDHLERSEGYRPDVVLRLVATAPLQTADDLDAVVDTLIADPAADSAMVVAEARQHPMKAMRREIDPEGRVRLVPYLGTALGSSDRVEPAARQAYAPAYLRANVVATRPDTLRRTGTLAGDSVACVVIDQARAVDIDTAADLQLAEVLLTRADPPVPRPEPVDGAVHVHDRQHVHDRHHSAGDAE